MSEAIELQDGERMKEVAQEGYKYLGLGVKVRKR